MNKYLKCILLLAIFVATVFGTFYFIPLVKENADKKQYEDRVKSQEAKAEAKAEEVEISLVQAGYNEAHKTYMFIYLDNTETDYVSVTNIAGDFPYLSFEQKRDDIPKILDSVMPLYDGKYEKGDGEKIMKRLVSDRFFSDDYTHGGRTSFNGYEYHEFLDETNSFTDGIMVEYSKRQ